MSSEKVLAYRQCVMNFDLAHLLCNMGRKVKINAKCGQSTLCGIIHGTQRMNNPWDVKWINQIDAIHEAQAGITT